MKDGRWLVSFWLAVLVVLYVWIRITRYEFHPQPDGLYVFDRWTTKVDRTKVSLVHFVSDPAHSSP